MHGSSPQKSWSDFWRRHGDTAILVVLVLSTAQFLISLPNRALHADDPWIAEYSYWISKFGYLRSELMRGLLNYEDKMYVYHKLHYLMGAGLVKLFGLSAVVLRGSSIVLFLLSLWLLTRLYSRTSILNKGRDLILAFALLFANYLIFTYAYVLRPEMLVLFLGTASFVCVTNENESKTWLKTMGGLLAGLSASAHLMGISFIVAGGVLLIYRRQIKALFAFGLAAGVGLLAYFYDIRSKADWEGFLYQFKNDPVMRVSGGTFSPLARLLDEPTRYFYHAYEGSLTLLFLCSVWFNWKYLKEHFRPWLVYYFTAMVVLAVTAGKASNYLIIFMPFFITMVVVGFKRLPTYSTGRQRGLLILALLYVLINWNFNIHLILRAEDTAALNAQAVKEIPKGSKILSNLTFVFNELENYQIQAEATYVYLYVRYLNQPFSLQSFLDFAEKHDRQYILLDKKFTDDELINVFTSALQPGERAGHYEMLPSQERYIFLRRFE